MGLCGFCRGRGGSMGCARVGGTSPGVGGGGGGEAFSTDVEWAIGVELVDDWSD